MLAAETICQAGADNAQVLAPLLAGMPHGTRVMALIAGKFCLESGCLRAWGALWLVIPCFKLSQIDNRSIVEGVFSYLCRYLKDSYS